MLLHSSFCKTAFRRQRGGVTCTMQYANDHQFPFIVKVVDGVIADKTHAQTGSKLLPPNT